MRSRTPGEELAIQSPVRLGSKPARKEGARVLKAAINLINRLVLAFDRRPARWVLLAAVGMHVGVILAVVAGTGRLDAHAFSSLDAEEYHRIAANLLDHGTFSQAEAEPLEPDTWRTPGYPIFLAAAMLVVGRSATSLIVVQQLVSVLNVFLLYCLARRFMPARRAGLVALIFLIEPYHLLYTLWLLSATVFITVLLLTWHAWERAIEKRSVLWAGTAGVLVGLLVLIRPIALVVPFLMLAGLIGMAAASKIRKSITPPGAFKAAIPLAFALCASMFPAAWMFRNQAVAGHFALSSQGGIVLAYFKATEVELWRQGRTEDRYLETSLDAGHADDPHPVWEKIDERLRERFSHLSEDQRADLNWRNLAQGNRTGLDSFEVSKGLGAIGREYLIASPLSTITCSLVRGAAILSFPLNLALKPPAGQPVSRPRSWLLGLLYLTLPVGCVVRLLRGGWWMRDLYFPLASTAALLLATTPQLDPRFRVPMIPMLALIALLPRVPKAAPASSLNDLEPRREGKGA